MKRGILFLLTCTFLSASAQIGKNIEKAVDTAGQKQKIKKMPTDTAHLKPKKLKEPGRGGEHSATDSAGNPNKKLRH